MTRKQIDELLKLLRENTNFKFFLLDPESMTEAELKEVQNQVDEEAARKKRIDLGIEGLISCSNCGNEIPLGSSLCTNCGKS
jgi:hypothetical protein